MVDTFSRSEFVWLSDDAPRRNQFVRFRRSFLLSDLPEHLYLSLFADTRYRLWVNHRFVCTGPGRFVTQHPEFDAVDLASFLQVGANEIVVEVNFFGASSFQTMPDGQPGFIAAGGGNGIDFCTPGEWTGERSFAWAPDAPVFSFAQGPVEVCDTRVIQNGIPSALRVLSGDERPWGPLTPYSGTPLPFNWVEPRQIELAGPLLSAEDRIGFMVYDPEANQPLTQHARAKPWVGFAAWIHSPRPQQAVFSCFWSDLRLNEVPLVRSKASNLGNHNAVGLELKEGWNLLTGEVEVLTEGWAYLLGVPRGLGISLHAVPDLSIGDPLALGPVQPRSEIRVPTLESRQLPDGWRANDGRTQDITPARMMGWDATAPEARRAVAWDQRGEVASIRAESATWCFSFEGEFHGHLVVEVEAPEGTAVDIACDDWQRDDGGVALYRSNPFTDAADRFILSGGRQQLELFHPRGGKLVQVTMRAPEGGGDGEGELTLHDLGVRSRLIYTEDESRFDSDHPVLNWAWPVSIRTLTHSTDDAYADCPWRERGSYIGDGLVNLHLNLLFSSDLRTAIRTFRTFGQAQLPDGQLACCAPAWLRRPHEDFTLLWILAIHDLWAYTGDASVAHEMWPVIERIWASETWKSHSSGLWNLDESHRAFFDWGILPAEREGEAHGAINLLRMEALRRCARLSETLGDSQRAAAFLAEAEQVESAILELLWHPKEDRLRAASGTETPALHTNVLALAFGLGTRDHRLAILDYLEPQLRTNLARGLERGQFQGHLELYFLSYLLPALAELGRPDLAEAMIDDHYGYLRTLGADTLPECFCRVESGEGSRCHSWSGGAAIYAARYVLGLRLQTLGEPNTFVFAPIVSSINRASGRIAHPLGWIEVEWERIGDGFRATFQHPDGVTIRH